MSDSQVNIVFLGYRDADLADAVYRGGIIVLTKAHLSAQTKFTRYINLNG